MNSIHRRLVSLLLVFVLIFSAIPTSVFATDTDRENENLDKDILLNEQAGQADNFEENSDEIDSLLQDTENTTSNISAYSMIPVESISVNEDSLTIEAGGDTASLEAKVLPEDATNRNIVWTSSAPEIATVSDEGTVTPVSEGTADIIATADGVSTKCVVTVLSAGVTVTGITLDKNTLEMTAGGETAALVATVLPEDATSKDVTWTSSAPTIATVANGIVTPVSEGSAIITATAGDFSAECTVTVVAAKVAVTGVALDQHELTLNVKETGTLKATLVPENATNKALTWSSSAEAVATVEDGVVTAVAMGTTTITVATEDGGFTDSCTVTVWGTCGTNVTWFYNATSKTLKIAGSGAIADYAGAMRQPWKSYLRKATTVELGEDITRIGKFAFAGCAALTSITIPDNSKLKEIGTSAFMQTSKLKSISLPNTLTHIDDIYIASKEIHFRGTASQWESLSYTGKGKVYVLDENGRETEYVPDPYNGKCGDNATWHFAPDTGVLTISGTGEITNYTATAPAPWDQYKEKITKAVVENGITSVGNYAFASHRALQTVELAGSVTKIGDNAFQNAEMLSAIDLKHVTSVGQYAFERCVALTSLDLGAALTIGRNAFYECTALENVVLGNEKTTLSSIGLRAFEKCSKLETVTFKNVANVGQYAFKGTAVKSVDLTSVTKIDGSAFENAKGLETVTFGKNLTSLGGAAFANTAIKEISIPGKVTTWGNGSFSNCHKLTKVEIQEGINTIPKYTFQGSEELCEVTLPVTLTQVGEGAFNECRALATVNYTGTWSNVEIQKDNDPLLKAIGFVAITGITLDKNTLEMTAGGETAALVATVLPEDATSKDVTWTSSAPTIATVANGIVTPVSEGSAIITATAGDFSAECTVTVVAAKVAVTGVALDQHELTLNVKETGTLKATLVPENATNKALTWSSSAEAVATVEDGVVTAVAMGTTTITVATEDGGFTDSCTVTVEKEETEISLLDFSFRIWGSKADGYIGSESLKIVADGNDEYHLIAPTYAVFPAGTAKLLISAPEDLKEEYTVTYTSWNNQDSEYCNGEKTVTSLSGAVTVEDYYNRWGNFDGRAEFSDFVIRIGGGKKEYKIVLSLYNDLQRLWVYPSASSSTSYLPLTRIDEDTFSATVIRGTEYTILARGGCSDPLDPVTGKGITPSVTTISEVDGQAESQGDSYMATLKYTPGEETEKTFQIRITNSTSAVQIAEKTYTLKLKVKAPETLLAFEKYTAVLNGTEVNFESAGWSIPQITQYDDLKITVHLKNAGEDALYAWTSGVGVNTTPVGENSATLTVDTSSVAVRDYCFRCSVTSNGQSITTGYIRVKKVNVLSVPTPVIVTQPVGAEYNIGQTATVLKLELDNKKQLLARYQWYVSEEPDIATAKLIDGANDYYYLPPIAEEGTRYYCCEVYYIVKDMPGDKVVSDFAKITVNNNDVPFPGMGTAAQPYILSSEADLAVLREKAVQGYSFKGMHFQFANDISLSKSWIPIGTTKDGSENTFNGKNIYPFSGVLDGNGYTVTIAPEGKPLFNYVREATVKNLNIKGEKIDGYGLVDHYVVDYGDSGIYNSSTVPETINIVNCHILAGTSIKNSGFLGGYASGINIVRITDCSVAAGVIIGYGMTEEATGSLAGEFNGFVDNCTSAATVQGSIIAGGLVGCKGQSMGPCTITNSSFTGTVSSKKDAGGILGGGYHAGSAPNSPCVNISDCRVTGEVTGTTSVGGILGAEGKYITQCWDNGIGGILNNEFTGKIHASGKNVGAIIGFMCSMNICNRISNNYYAIDCGAERGIGFVKYVDTSCENHETQSGTIYFDTSRELPDIAGVGTKNLNRTDDPLGADKEKLCYTEKRTKAYVTELIISGTYKTEYQTGEKLDTNGIVLTAKWSDGTTTTPSVNDATITGFDSTEAGKILVTIEYEGAMASFNVDIKPKFQKITVSVTVMGDSHHSNPSDNGGPHGLAMGGLSTWTSESNVEADATETVWDVIQRVAQSKNLKIQAVYTEKYSSYYIESVNGLGEFDNGKFSGWMYTVNGTHPQVGVSKKYLKQGDVIILHYTDDYTKEEGSMAPAEDTGTAQKVIDLINKIGTVTYTDACKQRIDAARSAYDALTAAEKNKVGTNNLATLTKAEAEYKRLMQAGATDVDNLISKIGTVTANSGPAISNAWNAYNALTAEQKALVKNFNTLQEATQKWNQLKADEVVKLIDKIKEPVTEKSKASIEAARKAYDGLTDAQKRLVTNTKKLTDAEKAYAQLTATPEDKEDAQKVIDLIKKLTNVTLDSEKDIQAARKAYDALTDLQKKLVDNYDVLTAAETKLAMLKAMGKVSNPYITTGDYMEALGTPSVGSIGGEWMVIGLARSDRNVPGVEDYYKKVQEYVAENIDPETGRLHKAKSTDNSRIIIALTAIGKDVTNVGGYNLLAGLSDLEFVKYQGNNGPIWALLALDSGNYPVPSGGTVTRQALIDEILRVQTSDGGWTVSGDKADSDMTGMALTALAPYYKKDLKVQEAIDKAIARLSEMQDEDGGYSTSYDGTTKIATSESISQVVTALSALGINADTDARFIKNGSSVVDALLRYYVSGGGFKHVVDGAIDGMGTEQAYYALTAYYRFLSGKTSLYDMTDIIDMGGDPVEIPTEPTVPATTEPTEVEPAKTGFPWWILVICVVGGCGLGMVIAIVIIPKFGKFKKKD